MYPRNGGQRRGGNQRQLPKRAPVGGVHQLDPVIEAILTQYEVIQGLITEGSELAREIVRFNTPDGQGVSMEAFKGLIIHRLGFAVPHDHPQYPAVGKINTQNPLPGYYPMYRSRIRWKNDENYWHIPTFSRYVINEAGHVKNAYNGMDVLPNDWGRLEMVPDRSPLNDKPNQVDLTELQMLAFRPLPADFVCYGNRQNNYVLGYDVEAKAINWVKRPEVVVRDQMSIVEKAANPREYALSFLKGKDRTPIASIKDSDLALGPVTVNGITVKFSDDSLIKPRVPVAVATPQPAAQPMTQQTTAPQQQTQVPAQQPAQQPAPAPEVPPYEEEIPF